MISPVQMTQRSREKSRWLGLATLLGVVAVVVALSVQAPQRVTGSLVISAVPPLNPGRNIELRFATLQGPSKVVFATTNSQGRFSARLASGSYSLSTPGVSFPAIYQLGVPWPPPANRVVVKGEQALSLIIYVP
jgi:hypothetical protein